jgi:MoxR-like ATPase
MFIINVGYPTMKQEVEIAMTTTSGIHPDMDIVLNAEQVQKFQQLVPSVPVSEHVAEYAVRLAQSSRPNKNGVALGFINEWVDWGAGPRASQYLLMGAKARALMDNRVAATIEDIKHVSRQVLEHRIVLNFKAEAENITTNDIVEKLLNSIKP